MRRDATNIPAMRAALDLRLAELLQRAERIDAHEREIGREVPTDSADRAQYREDDEVVERLDVLTRAEIASVRAALGRLQDGSFGACTECGKAIGARRLQVLPATPWCAACARMREP